MVANYWILDSGSSLVFSGSPYRRYFPIMAHRGNVFPYLTMWVKTGYTSSSSAASVRINGTEIDKILPRPWLNHSFFDDEAVSFIFSPSVLPIFSYPPQPTILDVIPRLGLTDWVMVSHVTYHWLS